MTELKTLKDLQKEYEWKYDTYVGLRKEAIKWIEAEKREIKIAPDEEHLRAPVIYWIKHFFNITKEELNQ